MASMKESQIYDALVSGDNRSALRYVANVLKKDPSNLLIQSFKAVALARTGELQESLRICRAIEKQQPLPEDVTSSLEAVYYCSNYFKQIATLYQKAYDLSPAVEIFGRKAFFYLTIFHDFALQKTNALRLFSRFKDPLYLQWALVSMILQDGLKDPSSTAVAASILDKWQALSPSSNSATHDDVHDYDEYRMKRSNLLLRCVVSMRKDNHKETLALLDSSSVFSSQYPVEFSELLAVKLLVLLQTPETLDDAIQMMKEALLNENQSSSLYEGLIEATFQFGGKPGLERLAEWLQQLQRSDADRRIRDLALLHLQRKVVLQPILACMELAGEGEESVKARASAVIHSEKASGGPKLDCGGLYLNCQNIIEYSEDIYRYVEEFCGVNSCFYDIRSHLTCLMFDDSATFTLIEKLLSLMQGIDEEEEALFNAKDDDLSKPLNWLRRKTTVGRCLYALGFYFKQPLHSRCRQAICWIQTFLRLGNHLEAIQKGSCDYEPSMEFFPVAAVDLLLLCDQQTTPLTSEEAISSVRLPFFTWALDILELALKKLPTNRKLLSLSNLVYSSVGGVENTLTRIEESAFTHIQVELNWFPTIFYLGSFSQICRYPLIAESIIRCHIEFERGVVDSISDYYTSRNYSQIPNLLMAGQNMRISALRNLALTEHVLNSAVLLDKFSKVAEAFTADTSEMLTSFIDSYFPEVAKSMKMKRILQEQTHKLESFGFFDDRLDFSPLAASLTEETKSKQKREADAQKLAPAANEEKLASSCDEDEAEKLEKIVLKTSKEEEKNIIIQRNEEEKPFGCVQERKNADSLPILPYLSLDEAVAWHIRLHSNEEDKSSLLSRELYYKMLPYLCCAKHEVNTIKNEQKDGNNEQLTSQNEASEETSTSFHCSYEEYCRKVREIVGYLLKDDEQKRKSILELDSSAFSKHTDASSVAVTQKTTTEDGESLPTTGLDHSQSVGSPSKHEAGETLPPSSPSGNHHRIGVLEKPSAMATGAEGHHEDSSASSPAHSASFVCRKPVKSTLLTKEEELLCLAEDDFVRRTETLHEAHPCIDEITSPPLADVLSVYFNCFVFRVVKKDFNASRIHLMGGSRGGGRGRNWMFGGTEEEEEEVREAAQQVKEAEEEEEEVREAAQQVKEAEEEEEEVREAAQQVKEAEEEEEEVREAAQQVKEAEEEDSPPRVKKGEEKDVQGGFSVAHTRCKKAYDARMALGVERKCFVCGSDFVIPRLEELSNNNPFGMPIPASSAHSLKLMLRAKLRVKENSYSSLQRLASFPIQRLEAHLRLRTIWMCLMKASLSEDKEAFNEYFHHYTFNVKNIAKVRESYEEVAANIRGVPWCFVEEHTGYNILDQHEVSSCQFKLYCFETINAIFQENLADAHTAFQSAESHLTAYIGRICCYWAGVDNQLLKEKSAKSKASMLCVADALRITSTLLEGSLLSFLASFSIFLNYITSESSKIAQTQELDISYENLLPNLREIMSSKILCLKKLNIRMQTTLDSLKFVSPSTPSSKQHAFSDYEQSLLKINLDELPDDEASFFPMSATLCKMLIAACDTQRNDYLIATSNQMEILKAQISVAQSIKFPSKGKLAARKS